ncbi:hypothetical protein ABL78_3102 [Leptomonas seymouri]|uniref:Uncharacterized protein n=1 Tax=Leptomonas seymouri TaxID=5684 RepID=A0A0N1HZZ2_LEPSE|nr:hypothetical protein ABL78_3102 [Leptomonas seymouri]|eukprot:KPI87803.1 hypothetical protein ABL78_3102 [Leptomonas seymouri]
MRGPALEKKGETALCNARVNARLGSRDCRARMHSIGVCGSVVQFLGHEASGVAVAAGLDVESARLGW